MNNVHHALLRPLALRLLIIGYGNPLRGDDALGWRAAEALASHPAFADDPLVQIETVHQLTPEVAELVAEARTTLFIDAAAATSNFPPGTLRCEEIHAIGPFPDKLGHHLTPAQILAYAGAIYGRQPRAYIASIAVESFDYGAPLTPVVETAIPSLVEWAAERLGDSLRRNPAPA